MNAGDIALLKELRGFISTACSINITPLTGL